MQINEQLINNFIKSADWEAVWNNNNFSQEDTEAIEKNLDYDVFDWNCGATKMVIIPKDSNEKYVIKIPFMYLYSDYEYDDDDEGYYYHEFHNAPRPKDGMMGSTFYRTDWDYCETEIEYCELAAAANISEFFPETIKYCDMPYPIYLQELCVPANRKLHKTSSYGRDAISEQIKSKSSAAIARWCYHFNAAWLQNVINWYGIEKLIQLFTFMEHYKMSDFHSDNYGYRESDGSPVLIDFAGFYEA